MKSNTELHHTPTPWNLNIWSSGRYTVESENGQVCEMNLIHLPGSPRANAEFIIRAVNSYNALLEAVKNQHNAIDELFAMLAMLDDSFFPSKSGRPWEALIAANKVIAQAEVKS